MSYLGRSAKLSLKAQEKVSFLATAGQTVKTGLSYTPSFVEVYVNGVLLTDTTDFTATNGNSITFTVALLLNDEVTVISLKTFIVADHLPKSGGTMTGDTLHGDNVKAKFGTGNDLQIFHDASHSFITESGTGNLRVGGDNLALQSSAHDENYVICLNGDSVTLYHNNAAKISTTATGVAVTGSTAHTAGDITNSISGSYKLFGANGTAGSTAYVTYAFEGDNNTGMYHPAADTLGFVTGGTARLKVFPAGDVVIGSAYSPTAANGNFQRFTGTGGISQFGVTGTNNLQQIQFFNGNGGVGGIFTNGSATSYNTSSDYRLKTDVQPMTGATDRVKLLKPCNFEWIVDGTRVDGFLAHEAQEVVPESVHGTKDAMRDEEYEVTAATDTEEAVMGTRSVPDMQGIDQSKLVPLLTATIQELIARIEALEGE